MGEQTRFILGIIVVITNIVIPMTDSTAVDTKKNTISLLYDQYISGSHQDVCCDAANNVGIIL